MSLWMNAGCHERDEAESLWNVFDTALRAVIISLRRDCCTNGDGLETFSV